MHGRPDLRHVSIGLKLLLGFSLTQGFRASHLRRRLAKPALTAAPPASTYRQPKPRREPHITRLSRQVGGQ